MVNLAWTIGEHELRFGTNTRIFRLNDYDFGEGVVPLVSYTTLPQFIFGVASTASETFPIANSEPYNFLNVDLYAQDTWKVTSKLTLTAGIRGSHNANPLDPHNTITRLAGSFGSILHDVNEPLNIAIQTGLGNVFSSVPVAIWQPRTAVAWQAAPTTVLRTGFGIFSDLLPGSVADLIGANPPYSQTFQGALLADRFHLVMRRESKEMSLYEISVAKNGPKLTKSTRDCTADIYACLGFSGNPRRLSAMGVDMADLASELTGFAGRHVLDTTGITGEFDFLLQWNVFYGCQRPTQTTDDTPRPPARNEGPMPDIDSLPDLGTALGQQLGLKLESRKGPVETYLIVSVERPSEN